MKCRWVFWGQKMDPEPRLKTFEGIPHPYDRKKRRLDVFEKTGGAVHYVYWGGDFFELRG